MLLTVVIAVFPSAGPASAAQSSERAATRATQAANQRMPRSFTRRIACSATVTPRQAARLSANQRAQLRSIGAYGTKVRVRGRTATRWWCLRSAAGATALRRLSRPLGARSSKLDVQAVFFPKLLSDRIDISLPEGDGAGWTLLGAPPVPAQPFARGAVYSSTEFDVIQHVDIGALKESIAVHRGQGDRTWRWKLDWDGGAAPRLRPDGTVRYGHDVVLAKPFLQDARGRRIKDLAWTLDGATLSVRFNDHGIALPYVLDPASSYPQRIHPTVDYQSSTPPIQGLISPPLTNPITNNSGGPAGTAGDVFAWSGNTLGLGPYNPPTGITNATAPVPQNMDGIAPCGATGCNGALAWGQAALGGATLPAGPYTIQSQFEYRPSANTASGGPTNGMPFTAAMKVRLWRAQFSSGTNDITPGTETAITDWTTSAPQTWVAGQQNTAKTFSVNPAALSLAARQLPPQDHLVVEYALAITDAGRPNNTCGGPAICSTFRITNDDPATFIDFGGPATNTPGVAANLRLSSPPVSPTGWTNNPTPTLRANLDDPDWGHHIRYQVCSDAACGTVVQQGTSAAGQMIGSTNDAWTVPTALATGTYYMRARTEEDGGDLQIGAWNNFTATRCTAPNVGACGQFGVDTVLPNGAITAPATGSWNRGTVTVSGTASDATSGVATHSLQWRRISPSPAGPLGTGVVCAGPSSPTWSCTWDTTTAIDGDYELQLTVTDVAGNSRLVVSSTYKVDNAAPTWPAGSFWRDGAAPGDVTWVTGLTTLGSNWSAAADANTISRYEYCLSGSPTGANCAAGATKTWTNNALAMNQTSTGLSLVEGGLYYSCVRAFDPAGNTSAVQCSNGQTVDTLPPALPSVNDGTGPDITWINQTNTPANTIQANWSGGGDAGSGVNRWDYCVTTSSSGADCAGAALRAWTSNALATSVSATPIATVQGTQYFVCVRVYDNAGNVSAGLACSDGQTKDTVPTPSHAAGAVLDGLGADINVQSSTTTISANWPVIIDPPPGSGVQKYQYCITTTAAGADCAGAATVAWTDTAPLTATTLTRSGLTLIDGTTYRVCIRSYDAAGNAPSAGGCSDGVLIDGVPPAWPAGASRDGVGPIIDAVWTTSLTTLSSHWSPATDANGIAGYAYCLTTSPTGADCAGAPVKGWTSNGAATTQTSTGLTLSNATTYYSCVRATDNAGNTGAALCSNGQTVDAVAPYLPPTVFDGTGADITWLQSLTTASANWPGGGDALSGINRWEYCISTVIPCSGTVVKTWTSSGAAVTQTSTALALVQGERYFTCVRGFDVAGNATATSACSDGQRVDTVAPPAPTTINDGTGADISFTSSATTLSANWNAVVDPPPGVGVASGLQRYQYCITTTAGGADCGGGATVAWTDNAPLTSTAMTRSGLTLTDGTTYRVCIRAFDIATNTGASGCSNGVTVDLGPPTASWSSWTENSAFLYSPGGANVDLLWYNPAAPAAGSGTATATVVATDPGSGMNRVNFPNLGASGWSPGGIDTTVGAGNTWSWDYMFTGGGPIGDPPLNNATAYDNGGAFTVAPTLNFRIEPDGVQPTVGVMPALSGLQSTTSVSQSIPLGTDSDSGVGRWVMDVQFAPLRDGVCQPWDPWVLGDSVPGYFGTATNGTTLNVTHYLNDANMDGVPDYKDSFCFRSQVRVYDNVNNVSTIPANGLVQLDLADPTVAISGPPGGSSQRGTFAITGTTTDLWTGSGPEYPNTGSGIQQVAVTYQLGAGPVGSACAPVTTFTGTWDNLGWTCSWNTSALTDGLYTIRVQARDRSGRLSTIRTTTYLLDNQPPVLAWHSWSESSAWMYSLATVAWVNPNAPVGAYQLDARVTAYDLGSGVNRVEFPAMGAGWTPAALSNATFTSPSPAVNGYTQAFTFSNPASLAAPGVKTATAYDGAGNNVGTNYEVRLDGAAPTGMDATVVSGRQNTPLVAVTLTAGSEGALESGLASWALEYQTAPLADDVCGAFGGTWTSVASGAGIAPATYNHDVTALGSQCYRYHLLVTDNVGNVGTSALPTASRRVDLTNPTVTITSPLTGTSQGGTFNVSGTASDANSGIDHVRLTWNGPGPGPLTGVICDPATLTGSSPTWNYTCSWPTAARDDGNHTITATSYDRAGNISAVATITVLLDNKPPVLAWHSWNESSPWMHSLGTVAWVNPNAPTGAYQLDARVTAYDLGSGVNRVEFPPLGAGWTPLVTSNATFTSPTPATNGYTQAFTFTNPASLAAPGVKTATAFDGAGNNVGTNFEVRLDGTAPTGMTASVVTGRQKTNIVIVSLNSGTDGASGSGVGGSWSLDYETAPLTNNICGTWTGSPILVATGVGMPPATYNHDVSALGSQCYRYYLRQADNVGNVGASVPTTERHVDMSVPTATIATPSNGASLSGTFSVSGSATDAHTGIEHVELAWTGPSATTGTICNPATLGGGTPTWTFTCSWATALLPDGNYTIKATSYDNVGNVSAIDTVTVLLDNRPPVLAWHSWSESSPWMHSLATVAWVNPNAPVGAYQLDARVTAYDLGSGVNRVEFPAMGAGWSPAALSNATFTSPAPAVNGYTQAFTFTNPASLAAPGVKTATAYDGAGNNVGTNYEVRLDGAAPTGMNATVVSGRQNTPLVAVTLAAGSEGALESGLASWVLEYQTAPLADDVCGTFGATWNAVASGAGIAPATYNHDVTALGSQCYRYHLLVTDNVGNIGTSPVPLAARRVDLTNPTVTITAPLNGSSQGGTFNVSGTASDAHTGIDHVRLTWSGPGPAPGPGPATGVICDPATLTGASPTWNYTCPWATTTLLDGNYTITATSYDRALNISAVTTITILLDNKPPVLTWHSWNDYGSAWTHAVGSLAWINPSAPAGTYSLDARVIATDLGSGVNRVEFPALGAGWTPGALSNAAFTSPVPAANAYTLAYSFFTPGIVAAPGVQQARAFDGSGNSATTPFEIRNDTAGPVGGTISYLNGYSPSTSVTVSFNTGADAAGESGFRDWQLVRSTGTLSGGTCSAWGPYATVVATGTSSTTTGSATDTVTDAACFRYRLRAFDNVSNMAPDVDGAQEVKVDLTPPTGSLVLAPGTNPAWQYLATPTRIYVNTSPGRSGTFTATATASAASGILDANFPLLATGFTGDGVVPGPGPSIGTTYAWSAGASAPAAGKFVRVRSNSLGKVDLPFEVYADPTAPVGATTSYSSGFTTGTSATVSFTIGNDGTGVGIQDHQLEREAGTLAAGACTWTGTWTTVGPLNGPLTQTDSSLTTANCYRYRVRVTDRVANIGYSPVGAPIMVDTTGPTSATMEFVEFGAGVGTAVSTPSANTIWYQPTLGTTTARQQFSMRVRVVDPESGPGVVSFPSFAGNWALGATTVNTDGASRRYDRWNYAIEPGAVTATATNGAGLSVPVTGNVLIDDAVSSTASWSIDYAHGYDITGSMNVTWVDSPTDSLSGYAAFELVRRSWPYVLGTSMCDQTAAFTDVSLGAPAGNAFTNTGLTQPTCYRYFLKVTDRAENVGLVWAATGGTTPALFPASWPTWDYKTVAEVDDIFPPAAFSLNLPTNPPLPIITTAQPAPSCETTPTFNGATPTYTWTPSSDAETGLKEYRVYVDGTITADATITAPGTSWTSTTTTDGAHTLGVRAYDNRLNMTTAAPAFPADIRVDSAPPAAALVSPTAGSWTSDTTPLLDWTASDANCLARVEVYLDDMVTPVTIASGTEGSWTPGTAIANGPHQWRIEAVDSLGKRTSSSTVSFGVDTTPPTAFALTSPTAGGTVRGFVPVAWTASSDADSGLAPASAYEVWVDGIKKATVSSSTTSTTVSGITNGAHSVYVRALDAVGNATVTTTVSFTGFGVIPAPVLVAPANTAAMNTVPTLTWNWPSDGGPAPTDFDVLLDGLLVGTQPYPTTAQTIADPGDGMHSWKVVQRDSYTGTVNSATWTFILDRTPPSNPGPLTRTVTTMSWPAPTDPAAPVASGIQRQEFWINDGINPPTFTTMAAGATARDYGTLPDGTYTMWVRAYDNAGNSTNTPSVVVVNDSVPPTAFALDAPAALPTLPSITAGGTAPACESSPTYVSGTPTLSWQPSSDATSGLAAYDVYTDNVKVASVTPATTSYNVPAPLAGGAHTWKVVARDGFGLSRDSTPAPMNVRIDGASPTIAAAAPADNAFTANTKPPFSWSATDDNCAARVEVTVDASVVAVTPGASTSWTPSTALSPGAHTWSLRVFDSAGNVVSGGPARTVNIDVAGPTGVTATFPTNGGSAPEQMMTFGWTAGSDPAGVSRYDLTVDGKVVASGLTATSSGTYSIYAGAHTWAIRAYDSVGNSTLFPFTYTATAVPDVTPPDAFNLLSPADNTTLAPGSALSWEPSWDFKGVTQYRVYIDGSLAGTTAGNVTSFTPLVGSGPAVCTINFDPGTSAGCLTGPTYTNGKSTGSVSTLPTPASSTWNVASQPGWNTSGNAFGFGDASVTPVTAPAAGFDGDRVWTAAEYTATVPAAGADLRFEHRYRTHMVGNNGYDGGTIELKVDTAGDGFGNDIWQTTCDFGSKSVYGASMRCDQEVVEVNGGYTAVLVGASASSQPMYHQHAFSGDSGGMVQTKVRLSKFAGKNIQIRFRLGTDSCYSGMPSNQASACTTNGAGNWMRAVWRIDDVTLAAPDLLPGPHTWNVEARDAAGNPRTSNQTWTFNL